MQRRRVALRRSVAWQRNRRPARVSGNPSVVIGDGDVEDSLGAHRCFFR